MNDITKSLRKNINEIKETKKNLIIEHSIVQSRLKFVLEQNYKSDREKSMFLLSEMIILEEQGYDLRQLNEQFDIFGFLGSLFGGSVRSLPEVIGEYLTDTLAKKLGINNQDYFYNVLKSVITSTNITDYPKLFTNCRFLSNKIGDGFIEAVLTQQQAKRGLNTGAGGFVLNAIRNSFMEIVAEKKDSIIQKLEDVLSDIICGAVSKWKENIVNLGKSMVGKVGTA
jgi:hypothetical protein